jgi:hypothetical protein
VHHCPFPNAFEQTIPFIKKNKKKRFKKIGLKKRLKKQIKKID